MGLSRVGILPVGIERFIEPLLVVLCHALQRELLVGTGIDHLTEQGAVDCVRIASGAQRVVRPGQRGIGFEFIVCLEAGARLW